MKSLLLIIILTLSFQSWTKADDITEFEIDGISIGESLLDHYSLEEIKISEKNPTFYPKSQKFKVIFFDSKTKKLYEKITFEIKSKDKNYIIHGIKGNKNMTKTECLKQKNIVSEQIKNVLQNTLVDEYTSDYRKAYGNSIAYISHFNISDGGMIRVWCSVWDASNEIVKDGLWKDSLDVGISTKELKNFIDYEAYD